MASDDGNILSSCSLGIKKEALSDQMTRSEISSNLEAQDRGIFPVMIVVYFFDICTFF
jgi:hypothetical protein